MAEIDIPAQKIPERYRKTTGQVFTYGTAGFRNKGEELYFVVFRVGILAVIRSLKLKRTVGVMITASHNPEDDNGVKIIDPSGEMLVESWEEYASQVVNARDDDLQTVFSRIVATEQVDLSDNGLVLGARDTRPSSVGLIQALQCGVEMAGGKLISLGLLTTPQLHYLVCCYNTGLQTVSEQRYYDSLFAAFEELNKSVSYSHYSPKLYLDCANGVGGIKFVFLAKALADAKPGLEIVSVNNEARCLNLKCGADYVKIEQRVPEIYTPGIFVHPLDKWASFDGDADRLVYYFCDPDGHFHLLDGDKIAALFAMHLRNVLAGSNADLKLGVVQTAYANGASTKFIEEKLHVPVVCTYTGVKHLHKEAKKLDIGIYFEANGHGTVLFGDRVIKMIDDKETFKSSIEQYRTLVAHLRAVKQLINQTTGDAISDLLMVETILRNLDYSIADWQQLYTDLPSRQLKVQVPNRLMIKTADFDRKCTAPVGLQQQIDKILLPVANARAFIRPSGTENVVRIYVESSSQNDSDRIADQIASLVKMYCTR